MKKKKLLLFIVAFSIGIIVTYPAFVSSHALDSYCTIFNGYKTTGDMFLQNSRFFSAFLMYFYDMVNLPVDSMNFVALFFLNLFLALAIVKLYLIFSKNKTNKMTQVILFFSTFLMFYTPLLVDVLILDDAMVYALGILFAILAASFAQKGGIKNYLFSLILLFLGISCYQGIICYFFVALFLLLLSNGVYDKESFVDLLKKVGIGIVIYLIVLFIFDIISAILNNDVFVLGNFDFFDNFKKIFTNFIPNYLSNLFGFIDAKIYYLISLALFGCYIYLFIKSDKKKINLSLCVILFIFLLLIPFVPNLFMNSNNYMSAKMCLTFGIIPSAFAYLILFNYSVNIKLTYVIGTVIGIWLLLSFYSFNQNLMINFKRFKEDVSYINQINQRIGWYEAENDIDVKKIYYAKDKDVDYYYSFGYHNSANIRLVAVDRAFQCAFSVYTNNKYELKPMNKTSYIKYFEGKNYNKFNKKQLVFDDDTLYLLLY